MQNNWLKSKTVQRIAYFILLAFISAYVLAIFFRPTHDRYGINQYKRSMFLDTINGNAYRPFAYRVLLPVTVRTVASITPQNVHEAFSAFVKDHRFSIQVFTTFQWEMDAAYTYFIASLLMWLSLMGFGHYAARLTMQTLNMDETPRLRTLLAGIVLLALPPFFRYTSYIYDPPQLFLFTLALYFLASNKMRAFLVTFIFCVLNKETAILLILIYAVIYYKQHPRRQFIRISALLVAIFMVIKLSINYAYRLSPGFTVEAHLLEDNFLLTTYGWAFANLLSFGVYLWLLIYKWDEKPYFLKAAFICTFPILFGLTLFFGLIDEWRDYYEAYPAAFALIVDSMRRLSNGLSKL
jgi:hypothetical protein